MTALAASLSRKATTEASSVRAARRLRSAPATCRRFAGVSITDGRIAFTRTCRSASSAASTSVSRTTPAFATAVRGRAGAAGHRRARGDVHDRAARRQPPRRLAARPPRGAEVQRRGAHAAARDRSRRPCPRGSRRPRSRPSAASARRGKRVPERLDLVGGQVDASTERHAARRGRRDDRSPRSRSASTIAEPSAPPRRRRARRQPLGWARLARNSRRSSGSSYAPRQNVVTVRECSSTPRICVQRCDASRCTATPAARQRRRARRRSARRAAPAP